MQSNSQEHDISHDVFKTRGSPEDTSPNVSSLMKRKLMEDLDDCDDCDDGTRKQKRSRGRPRLDTKDETAADRRRTQIRLAQRAYRHRKDTAITTLEDKVRELEKINADMSREFNQFYDVVLANGMLDASPQVAHRMRRITDNFLRLCGSKSDFTGYVSPEDEKLIGSDDFDTKPAIISSSSSAGNSSSPAQVLAREPPGIYDTYSTSQTSTGVANAQTPVTQSYEVVAHPTPENATFPFFSNAGPQAQGPFLSFMPVPPIYTGLPHQTSYAYHERTFASRLHRQTTERGLALASMAMPPPERFAEVFGFCLLFETREVICQRLLEELHGLSQHNVLDPKYQSPSRDESEQRTRELFANLRQDFLNSDDIELYLRRIGINVPQQADFVEATVDVEELDESAAPSQTSQSSVPELQYASMHMIPQDGNYIALSSQTATNSTVLMPSATSQAMTSMQQAAMDSSVVPLGYPHECARAWATPAWTRPKVTLCIKTLINELIAGAVCMGKTAGVRLKDVNRAVKLAVVQ